jgi:hypothetical protein
MRKNFLNKMAVAAIVAGASLPAFAQSGSSGTSGSAGLGIDYGALVTVSGSGNPSISLPGSAAPGMGGPIAGLAQHFGKRRNK